VNVGYEGGYAPPLKNTTDALLDALTGAIDEAGYDKKISIGLDSAASEFIRRENTMWMEKTLFGWMRCVRFLCRPS